jgi:hypothetical protein
MTILHPEITGHASDSELKPLAVTVSKACELSGFGPTSIWAFLKDGRLKAVRVPGVRRTLISYASLARLLTPATPAAKATEAQPIAPQLSSDDAGNKAERGSPSTRARKRGGPSKGSTDFRQYLDDLSRRLSKTVP